MFPKIVLLGDSITQLSFSATLSGFGAHLADVYQRRADVLNRGFSGYNTDWIIEYLSTSIGQEHIFGASENDRNSVRLMTIFFGANDASDKVLNERHHVPLERYKKNLESIHSMAKKSCPNAKFIILSPPPVHHKSRLKYQVDRYKEKATGKLERTLELSGSYANAAKEVAEHLNVPFLNVWQKMQDASNDWGTFLSDGLHLSKEGNLFVGENIVSLIQTNYPDLIVAPCPFTNHYGNSSSKCAALENFAPFHDEIDHKDPKDAFCNENSRKKQKGK